MVRLFAALVVAFVLSFASIAVGDAAPRAPIREQPVAANHANCSVVAYTPYMSTSPTGVSFSGNGQCSTSGWRVAHVDLYYKLYSATSWTWVTSREVSGYGSYNPFTGLYRHNASGTHYDLCGGINGNHKWVAKFTLIGSEGGGWVVWSGIFTTYLQPDFANRC